MNPELEAALEAARAAGELHRQRFGQDLTVETKQDDTPVTAVDRDSEALIRRSLEERFPGYGFLGEETADTNGPQSSVLDSQSSSRWIVDPLDGTKKFVRGLPFFGPCIALERDGELMLGVMHVPLLEETVWAERGRGAFRKGQRIQVSPQSRLDRAYVAYSSEAEFYRRGWGKALEGIILQTYHNPGFLDLYSYVALASGRVDAIINISEAPWDIAAARVIVEEAGGRLTDFTGAPSVYSGTAVTSNGRLHEPLLRLLQDCR